MLAKLKRFDWVMFAAMLALIAVGTMAIWSAGNAREETVFHDMWRNNLLTAAVGLVLYSLLAFTDYRRYLPVMAVPAYAAAVVFLVAVLFAGSTVYGGRRWLWFFQPSEVSKLCIISLLAVIFGVEGGRLAAIRPKFGGFAMAAAQCMAS